MCGGEAQQPCETGLRECVQGVRPWVFCVGHRLGNVPTLCDGILDQGSSNRELWAVCGWDVDSWRNGRHCVSKVRRRKVFRSRVGLLPELSHGECWLLKADATTVERRDFKLSRRGWSLRRSVTPEAPVPGSQRPHLRPGLPGQSERIARPAADRFTCIRGCYRYVLMCCLQLLPTTARVHPSGSPGNVLGHWAGLNDVVDAQQVPRVPGR